MSHDMEKIKEEKTIKSAFDSSTFDATVSIHIEKDPGDIGSATISPSGRDVAIASKTGLDIIDLDSPLNPPRQLRHGISWNVADVQWSPFALRDYWIASTANQKALVWNLSMKEDSKRGAIEHTLEAHTRAITDINFSAHHPDILSTCAVDGYVNCWDLRRPRRPVMTFVDWDAGATQVKWNRQDGHVLASSHDRWLRIWDDRKGAYPLRSIKAHESKIYGVDWNRTRSTGVVTCSLDKSIKFWDYSNDDDIPDRIIRTTFPVWRARHTPFGWGILAMPQDSPGNLYLYDSRRADPTTKISAPAVAIFQGHGDKQVKEFLWRARGGISDEGKDNRDFQLVSWGDDKELRLQQVSNTPLEDVGYVKGNQIRKNLNVTRKGAIYRTYRNNEKPDTKKKYATIKGPRHWSSSHDNTSSALTEGMKKFSPSKKYRSRYGVNNTTMKGRVTEPEPRNKIDWMSGIKFSKINSGEPGQSKTFPGRRLSVISPAFDGDREWDAPESLHDEIIRVHQQYTKVTFNDVNMDQRALVVSMNGPWGENREPVFLKVNINFPDHYPEKAAPIFELGKTSLISDEIYAKIVSEVEQIANGFVSRKRGSLEAALCYFLGEVDLEESTLLFSGVEDPDELDELADESSSDDDDGDIPVGASATMSQELDSSATDGMLAPQMRHANAPPPPLCGGRFNGNGKLVCFFPPKEEKFKSLLGNTNLDKARPRGAPYFNAFSSLRREVLPAKSRFSELEADDIDSSDSGESQASSSSDSDSSQFQVSVAFDFWRRVHGSRGKTQSTNRSQKSSIAATGTGTGSKGRHPKPKNTISIHDIQRYGAEYIPSKRELADQYAVFGDGLDVCNHNAQIAAKYGFQDRADIWTYAGMLLQHEVPLEVLEQAHRKETILVIARDMVKRCRRDSGSDSGIDVSYHQSRVSKISGRVKWGHNPLAKPLIDGLFDHFEKLADIQMLAMLSCVFSEPASGEEAPSAELRFSQPQTPLSMKTPAFSVDYFPTDAAAWSVYQKTPFSSRGSTPKTVLTPSAFYGSLGSSNGPWSSDPASASYSTGETPPKRSRSSERLLQHTQNLSIAPEESRTSRRSNAGLASSFAANFTRSFSATAPSSPPHRKRPSPVENMLSSLAPAVTWGSTTVLESVREKSYQSRASYSDDEITIDDYKLLPVTGIRVRMFNQDSFDDEGCLSASLLDCNHTALFSSYRKAYANLLYMWNLPLQLLEIVKFDGLPDYFQPQIISPAAPTFATSITSTEKGNGSVNDMPPPSPTVFGKREQLTPDPRGLDITGYCLKHDYRLEPLPFSTSPRVGGAVGRCERCKMEKSQLHCVVCTEPIAAMYVPCLSCGCASHQACLDSYHAVGETRCPGGCECHCNSQAGTGTVESWGALLMRMRTGQGRLTKRRDTEEWEASETKEWENARSGGMGSDLLEGGESLSGAGKGYSTLSKRLGQVRNTEWGAAIRRKGSTVKREDGI